MSAQIDASELTKLSQTFEKIASNLPKVTSAFVKTEGDAIIKEYHDTVPVRTGRLQNSVHGALSSPLEYKGGATVIYAPIVEKRRGNLKAAWDQGTAKIKTDLDALGKQIVTPS